MMITGTIYKRINETYVITYRGLPYHVIPGDPLYDEVVAAIEHGADWEWEPTPPDPTEAEVSAGVRAERNRLLKESDWTQLVDSTLDETTMALWQSYRQALRDVPDQAGFPASVTWPVEPGA